MPDILGKRVDEILSHQELQRFPEGTATHQHATEAISELKPELIELMLLHEVIQISTKTASASLDDDGTVTVKKIEIPL